jgi:plastocyanin
MSQRYTRRQLLATAGAVATAGVAGCTATGSVGGGDDFDVGMTAVAFDPVEVTVEVGDEVVWRNTSSRGHTVTAYESRVPDGATYFASGGFDSQQAAYRAWTDRLGGLIAGGETYAHAFETPGTHHYYCIPHEGAGMVGRVVVEE